MINICKLCIIGLSSLFAGPVYIRGCSVNRDSIHAASISPSGSKLEEVDLPEAPLHSGPLPQGWAQKTDHKTGRPYFEKYVDPSVFTPILSIVEGIKTESY